MRIAYVIPVFPEIHNTFILNQITGMIDRGHEVDLYPLAVGDYERAQTDVAKYGLRERVVHIPIPHGRVARVARAVGLLLRPASWRRSVAGALDPRGGRRVGSLVPLYTALSFVGRGPYHVVHAQFGHLGPAVARLAVTGGVVAPLVTSFRGADTTTHLQRNPAAYAELFRVGSLFLPVSHELRERVLAAGAPKERTVVHHSGIDLRRFSFGERRLAAGGDVRLLFVGRLVEKKGVRFAIEALALVLGTAAIGEDGAVVPRPVVSGTARDREVTLTIIGDGPERASMETMAQRLGVGRSVRFVGTRTHMDVVRTMHESHVLVAPSVTAASGDQEGIPNVVKEAMATGMPVVSTRHGGIPELVADGESGYLVAEADAGALAERIRLLVARPEDWARMGAAGRTTVEDGFDAERLNDALERHYEAVHAAWAAGRG